jgi:hypothetical protein
VNNNNSDNNDNSDNCDNTIYEPDPLNVKIYMQKKKEYEKYKKKIFD